MRRQGISPLLQKLADWQDERRTNRHGYAICADMSIEAIRAILRRRRDRRLDRIKERIDRTKEPT
jgi:hypothetical protein